jgi:murein DD-endopeptidase MepM/ murein hydrolase activator NlpD
MLTSLALGEKIYARIRYSLMHDADFKPRGYKEKACNKGFTTELIALNKTSMTTVFLNIKAAAIRLRKSVSLKARYYLTKDNRPRLRYLCLGLGVIAAGVLAFSLMSGDGEQKKFDEALNPEQAASISNDLQDRFADSLIARVTPGPKTPPFKKDRTLTIGKGETIAGQIQKEGVSGQQAYFAVEALSKHFDPRKIRVGQSFDIKVTPAKGDEEHIQLSELNFKLDTIRDVRVVPAEDEKYAATLLEKEVSKKVYGRHASIQTSLYGSAALAGIPAPIIAEAIRVYSWDVDFQRDIRRGDTLNVMYEAHETEEGDIAKYGNILYANLTVNSQPIEIYRFTLKNGDIDYFTEDGWSVRKALMKTPIDGARMSSGFGMRHHPILGYNKMHKGADFAAPTGTPIYAAGDGTLEHVGRKGAYGNYIRIRHNSTLKTAYAHLNKFAKGMSASKRVKQGQIIGYVGTTGRSTGPHLHYEVLLDGKQVNPNRIDLPTGEKLKGTNYANLQALIKKRQKEFESMVDRDDLAKSRFNAKEKNSVQ